ncbi:MAG: hypothetical protein E7570_07085 [Ruminococcaceae bacterium]|nr:hypothetical protein [Oscillospiraceae bacterium]
MKTLMQIQKIFKAGKILSKIGKITCIVGACIGAFGILGIALIPDNFKIGGTEIKGLVDTSATTEGEGYASLIVMVIMCIGYAVLFRLAEKYFKNELNIGTPFTLDGGKELTILGLYVVCIPLITNFAGEIAIQILQHFMEGVKNVDLDYNMNVGLGFAIIVMGMLCRCGAELMSEKKEAKNEDISI